MSSRGAGVALLFAVLLVPPARAAEAPAEARPLAPTEVQVHPPVQPPVEILVLYPPDLAFSIEPKMKIFAYRASMGDPVIPAVNGKAAAPLEGETFLKGEVSLSAGMNLLQVGGKILRVFFLPDTIMDALRFPSGEEGEDRVFQAYRLHPALDDGCEVCHTLEGGKLKAKDQMEACYACHNDFSKADGGKKVFVHAPVDSGECTSCHDPHFATRPKLQKLEKGCLECHDPFPTNGTVHAPVRAGECGACHSPHAGPAPKQLLRAGNALCLGCHKDTHMRHRSPEVTGTMTSVPETFPLDNGSLACAGCHVPHQSGARRLLKGSGGELCTICHRM